MNQNKTIFITSIKKRMLKRQRFLLHENNTRFQKLEICGFKLVFMSLINMAQALLVLIADGIQTNIEQGFGWASERDKIRGGQDKQGGRIWQLF